MSIEGTQEIHQTEINRSEETRPNKNIWIRIIIYLVIVGAGSYLGYRIYENHQQSVAASAQQARALMARPVPVQVSPVVQRPMPIYLTALGTVMPYMSVTVKARVNGQLLPVKFTEGQEVKQGQTIMEIDPKPYQAALDQAKGTLAHDEALLKDAQAEYGRYKALYAAGVVSKETMEGDEATQGQYEGAIASDKAAIENAQLQLNWCYIQSPISGKIGLRLVDPGNIITANTTNLVVINQFKPIAVYFTLPENELPQVLQKLKSDKKMPVDAYDQADTQQIGTGQLLTADNEIDTTTGTAKLKAVFNNEDESLFPNQFVNIHLVMEERPSALVVPSAAIQNGSQGAFVWTVKTDDKGATTAQMLPVTVALAQGQVTILDSGVTPGAMVVVDGADRLRQGGQVTVSQAKGGRAGGKGAGQGAGQGNGAGSASGSGSAGDGQGTGQHHHKEQQ